eukprot:1219208-Pyramimonas_sp.AAC.1
MPGVSVTRATSTTSRIDYVLVSVPFAAACAFTGLVPVPWGTHCVLGFGVASTPRCTTAWKAMRPRALPVKDLAGPAMSWPHHPAQAELLQRRRPAFFRANYFQATLLSLEHDNAD